MALPRAVHSRRFLLAAVLLAAILMSAACSPDEGSVYGKVSATSDVHSMNFDDIYDEGYSESSYDGYTKLRPGTRQVSWKSTCCSGDTFVVELKIKKGEKIEPKPMFEMLGIQEKARDRLYAWRVREDTIEERQNELVESPDDAEEDDDF